MSNSQDPVSVVAVAGSLRKGSYNRVVLEAAAEIAPSTVDITIFDGLDTVPVFNEDLEDSPDFPPGVIHLRKAIAASDGLLISTPEYNQSLPGSVKNMIDWLSRTEFPDGLAGRPVAVTGATTGPWGTRISQTLLKQMLHSAQALVMPAPNLFIPGVESLLDSDGRLVDYETLISLEGLLNSFADWIHMVGSP